MQSQSIFSITKEAALFNLRSLNILFTEDTNSCRDFSKTIDLDVENNSKNLICLSCNVNLLDRDDQVIHYKSDWHRFNLKRKIKNLGPSTEKEFEELTGNLSNISSISGSESEEEFIVDESLTEDNIQEDYDLRKLNINESYPVQNFPVNTNLINPILIKSNMSKFLEDTEGFKTLTNDKFDKKDLSNKFNSSIDKLNLSKIILNNEHLIRRKYSLLEEIGASRLYMIPRYFIHTHLDSKIELIKNFVKFLENEKWAILMGSAGHFAAAIFQRDQMIFHKTFHRYVIRAKRGSSQGKFDSQGKNAKSAGAALRRHNEKALLQEIINLIKSWSNELNTCSKIFLRAPALTRKAIFSAQTQNHKSIIEHSDWRVSMVSVPTRRPTLKEVQRVHQVLSSIVFYDCNYETYMDKWLGGSTSPSKIEKSFKDNTSLIKSSLHNRYNSSILNPNDDESDMKNKSSTNDKKYMLESTNDSSDDYDIDETEMALSWHMSEFQTSQLKTFDSTKKPRKRRKKKNSNIENKSNDVNSDLVNRFIEFCKNGVEDVCILDHLLRQVHSNEDSDLNGKNDNCNININNKLNSPKNNDINSYRLTNTSDKNELNLKYPIISEKIEGKTDLKDYDLKITAEANLINDTEINVYTSKKHSYKINIDQLQENCVIIEACNQHVTRNIECEFLCKLYNGESFLHIASNFGQSDVVAWLLANGADPTLKNSGNQTAYQLVMDKQVRNQFRLFRFLNPDKYDYKIAKIPEPLTDEMLNARRQKNSEKKKVPTATLS